MMDYGLFRPYSQGITSNACPYFFGLSTKSGLSNFYFDCTTPPGAYFISQLRTLTFVDTEDAANVK